MKDSFANHSSLLINCLSGQVAQGELLPLDWEILIRQARASGLLERLAVLSLDKKYFSAPDYVVRHLESAKVFYASQQRILFWELHFLDDIFKQLQMPLVLLKGSAYAATGLNASIGRVFNDIDILVPEHELDRVKNALAWHGWVSEAMDAYDQRYYKRWMHELPPMRHIERNTSLDVHHNIVPKTCRLCPDAEKLLDKIVQVPGTGYWTLQAEDMILHSASHLFLGGEFDRGLRDLSDIDLLLRQFSQNNSDFYPGLVERGQELGLQQPLFYALNYCHRVLNTPIPKETLALSSAINKTTKKIEDFIFIRGLTPDHPSCNDRWTGLARFVLYIRSHWLKMPLYLLMPHLLRKSWMRITGKTVH